MAETSSRLSAATVATDPTLPESPGDDLAVQMVGGAKWTALSRWGSLLVTWPAVIALARLLTPEDFGYLALVTVFTRFAALAAEGGISSTIVLGEELSETLYRRLHGWSLAFFGAASLLLIGAAYPIEQLYSTEGLRWLVIALTTGLMLEGVMVVPTARLRRAMRFRRLALINSTSVIMEAFTSVGCALAGLGYWSLIVGHVTGRLVGAILTMHAFRMAPAVPALAGLRKVLTSSGQLLIGSMSTFIGRSSDAWIGAAVAGAGPLGGYVFMKGLAEAPVEKISGILVYVSSAALGNIRDHTERLRRVILRLTRLTAMLMLPIFVGIALVANDLVAGLLGAQWIPYVPALQVYCAYAAVLPLISILQQGVIAAGGSKDIASTGLMLVVLMPPAFYLLGGAYGATGLALGWLIPLPLVLRRLTSLLFREVALRRWELLLAMVRPAMSVGIMATAVLLLGSLPQVRGTGPILRLLLLSSGGAAVYVGTTMILQRQDVFWLWSMLRPRLSKRE